jgi:hypothetical protein
MPREATDMPADETPLPVTRRIDVLIALGLFAVVLVTGGLRMADGVCGVCHDDAIYVSTAKSLADGDGYRMMGVPGTPNQTKYPILYPAILAVFWKCWPEFPANLVAMQWFGVASGAATLALGYLYLVRFGYFSRGVALTAALLSATAVSFLYLCTTTMAEMPFALLTIVALWGLDHFLLKKGRSRIAAFGLGILSALPFLSRIIGMPKITVASLLLFKTRQRPSLCLLGASVVFLPWVLWSMAGWGGWAENQVDGYYTDYLGSWSSTGLGMFFRVFHVNSLAVAYGSTEFTVEGLSNILRQATDSPWVPQAMTVLGTIPWLLIVLQLRTRRALPHFMAGYLGIMLVWSWPPNRFLIPLMPLITAYLVHAIVAALRFVGLQYTMRPVRWICWTVTLAIVLCNIELLMRHSHLTDKFGYPYKHLTNEHANWFSFQQTFAWLRKNSSPDDVIASCSDSMVSLYCDRQSFRPFVYHPERLFYGDGTKKSITTSELATILRSHQPRYFAKFPTTSFSEENLFQDVISELRQDHANWIRVVYRGEDPRFIIYEIDPRFEPAALAKTLSSL